jgi:hypothetical protein
VVDLDRSARVVERGDDERLASSAAVSGEHLWAMRKHDRLLECELRDRGEWGVEVQVFREGEFLFGRLWPTRALAIEDADERKAQYRREGGVLAIE